MAADHYLNKVFIYILPVKTTIPHQPFPAPFTKSSTRGRRSCCSRPRVALPAAASSTNGGRGQMTSS